MKHLMLACLFALTSFAAHAMQRIDLGGEWKFKTTLDTDPHTVIVPHCWLVETGYERYVGHALYERDFNLSAIPEGKVARLKFEAVYDVAVVWINGQRAGRHEGGYTAFEIDVTRLLHAGKNHIVVDVDNTPTLTSIPSLATGHSSTDSFAKDGIGKGTIVGWLPYGGIVRPVELIVSEPVYFHSVKIDAIPNLQTGVATLTVNAVLHNAGAKSKSVSISGTVAGVNTKFRPVVVPAHGEAAATWSASFPQVHLWSVRDPHLYDAKLNVADDSFTVQIGVRKVEVQGTRLLLNGREVHLNGANRVGEDEHDGLRESDTTIERDLSDMLADNMRMMRIAHYPQPQNLLNFADQHGMLIIPEAGNWNMSGWQMADPEIRKRFQQQMLEMMEQDWNHPSVFAWSIGNEYESYKKEGIDWTRDMRTFALSLDPTRLVTFADRYTGDASVKLGTDDASQYSDFVSINIYGDYARRFDHVHQLYPGKPVFVSEFGKMGEPGKHDPQRIADITDAMTAVKTRPWMIGASLWTWNDYRSFIKGTPADGIRRWGVVNLQREHRDSWKVVQELFKSELP